ncbi:hypothetical protein [Azospirillum tabaci]|uniref:hypothetical protein n=1 Tax=Azospirillum tabaci TaxID=2752310 RepID=UPI0016610661|nr:hypothetical protein [Azospirillum tabaci]
MSRLTAIEVAAEHCAWARRSGLSARQVVEAILGRPVAYRSAITWHDASHVVAAWWDAMKYQRRRAAA